MALYALDNITEYTSIDPAPINGTLNLGTFQLMQMWA